MRVCAVIVFFNPVKGYIEKIIDRLVSVGIEQIVIVNNGHKKLTLERYPGFRVLRTNQNLGASGGYKLGISEAIKTSCDYIWLLDDDNLPQQEALTKILDSWKLLKAYHPENKLMALSYRPDLFNYLYVIPSGDLMDLGPRKNSYLGFHYAQLFSMLKNRLTGVNDSLKLIKGASNHVRLRKGYYGGLFFHQSAVEEGVLPDEKLFMYWDDMDFTSRFHDSGGAIYLIKDSILDDLDQKEIAKQKSNIIHHPILDLSPSYKSFFYARNLRLFELKLEKVSKVPYVINKVMMHTMLLLMALFQGKTSRYVLMRKAVQSANRSVKRDRH